MRSDKKDPKARAQAVYALRSLTDSLIHACPQPAALRYHGARRARRARREKSCNGMLPVVVAGSRNDSFAGPTDITTSHEFAATKQAVGNSGTLCGDE